MTHIGMLTPKRYPFERSKKKTKENDTEKYLLNLGLSLFDLNTRKRIIRSPFHDDDDDTHHHHYEQNSSSIKTHLTISDEAISSIKKESKTWSVRSRRDVPNLLRGDR